MSKYPPMQRRTLLRAFGAMPAFGALGTVSTKLFAAPSGAATDVPRFLLVFLRGGYDAMSLLVPTRNDFYASTRPQIAIDPARLLPLTAEWSLHPALQASLHPWTRRGEAAFVPFAGTDDVSRSHFETQDSIERGQPTRGDATRSDSGFMNRLAAALGTTEAISFTDQLPLVFRGSVPVDNQSLRNIGRSALDPRMRDLVASMYREQPLGDRVRAGFALRDQVAADEGKRVGEMAAANRNAVSAKGFEQEARRVARLMRERHVLGFIDIGGWDTHVGQGAADGYLASRFEELGRGLVAYADEMGPSAWQRTVVVVMSEFGRTWRENGNRGTDHGHGSVYWVLGGRLRCPPVVGEQTALRAGALFEDRDLPVLNDYRAVLGRLFIQQFGLSAKAVAGVFPGTLPAGVSLV